MVYNVSSNPISMPSRRTWFSLVLIVAGIEMLFLVAQYFLGLWTNVYAPSMFTSNSSFPSLDWHYNIGFTLFFVGIALLILTGLARDWRLILGGVVVLVAVYLAGSLGATYVSSSPNSPLDSFGMGAMFLVALFANSFILMIASRARRRPVVSATITAAQPTPA
jgi:hypothetical protein